jgi:hypothetical protein
MALKNIFQKEIQTILVKFIEEWLTVDSNYSIINWNCIEWKGYKGISYALKNMSYDIIYNEMLTKRDFTFLMLDGWIIQMMYEFSKDGKDIIKHRLAYYPNMNIQNYGASPEWYEEDHFWNQLFSEMMYEKPVVVPVRFDYSNSIDCFVEWDHPYSHVTMGGYKNCRIANSWVISPLLFIQFVLKSFYFEKYKEIFNGKTFFKVKYKGKTTITKLESKDIHFNIIN